MRDCTEPNGTTGLTLCGFTYAGDCADFTNNFSPDPHACRTTDSAGNYSDCSASKSRSRQVITVYVSD